jgi:transforming growth factor-beta-induced protein
VIRTRHLRLIGMLLALVLALAACGGGDDSASDTTSEAADAGGSEMVSEPMASEMASEPMSSEMSSDMGSEGAAMASECQLEPFPESGDGSTETMAEQPAATAASGNANLTTLVAAVQEAGLAETLNGDGPFTIFAPANCAFEDIPEEDLDALLADTEQLTTVLTYHVVQGEALSAEDLAGMDSVTTVEGGDITLAAEGDTLDLNDGQATVVAPDVEVSNGVVHVIDGVLMPAGN